MAEPRAASPDPALLEDVPDLGDFAALPAWIGALEAEVARLPRDVPASAWISWALPSPLAGLQGTESPLGAYASSTWRRQVVATLAADWICYPRRPDQVALHRLQSVMHVFPTGFRTWWIAGARGGLPVGYAAWFPVTAKNFAAVEAAPEEALETRSVFTPLAELDGAQNHLYVFNYSVAPNLRRSSLSRRLLETLAAELRAVPRARLAAVTVSPEGARVAERFGMTSRASRPVEGVESRLYLSDQAG